MDNDNAAAEAPTLKAGSVEAPRDLKPGDIVLARTFDRENNIRNFRRPCLVMAFEFDAQNQPAAVWIMPFKNRGRPRSEDFILDETADEKAPGVELPAFLRGDQLHLIPLRQKFFTNGKTTGNMPVAVIRIGSAAPEFKAEIDARLQSLHEQRALPLPRGYRRTDDAYAALTLDAGRDAACALPGVPAAPATRKITPRAPATAQALPAVEHVPALTPYRLPSHAAFGPAGENYSRIAGSVREGDVVTAHVSSLHNVRDARKVYRPCIVLDVFEEAESGLPVGLMLLPCARVSHWDFADKVRLRNPFGPQRQRLQSFAVTNRVVVAPLTHRFVPGYHHVSNRLPDPLYQRILGRFHQTLDEKLDHVGIYGWQQLPRGWQSRRLQQVASQAGFPPADEMTVRQLLRQMQSQITVAAAPADDMSPDSILADYMQLRRLEENFDLRPKLSPEIEATLDPEDAPLERTMPQAAREKAPPVLPDDLQVGTIVPFRIPRRGYRDQAGRWHDERVQTQHGLVWMVFRDAETGHVGGAGIVPFETGLNQRDFTHLDWDGQTPALPDWQHPCLDAEEIARAGAPGRGRFLMNTLHLLPNTAKFFESRLDWTAQPRIRPAVMPELVARRENALMNANCVNRGFKHDSSQLAAGAGAARPRRPVLPAHAGRCRRIAGLRARSAPRAAGLRILAARKRPAARRSPLGASRPRGGARRFPVRSGRSADRSRRKRLDNMTPGAP